MELSNSNIKIILVFSEMKLCTSQPKPKKTKKNPHQKNFLYFPKWNFLALALKEFLYSLKRKLFLYFFKRKVLLYFRKRNPSLYTKNSENWHPLENSYFFSKESFYISGNENPTTETLKKLLIFQKIICEVQKIYHFF